MSDIKSDDKEVIRRLNSIIALLVLGSDKTQREILLALSNAGLRPSEIAKILGRLPHTVRAELSKKRKASQR
jgi:DNA-binding CsgD family transcriptional regulator